MAFTTPGEGETDEFMADINVTPLVDVVLVLLFIFMVTAPLLTMALEVEVPEVTTAAPTERSSIVIVVGREGNVSVDERVVTVEEAVELAAEKSRAPEGGVVYLRGDKEASYGFVAAVLDALRRGGVSDVALVTEQLRDEEGAAGGRSPQRR